MSESAFPQILGTATLNEKGQVVIPAEARSLMGLNAGSKVVIMKSSHKDVLIILKAEEVEATLKKLVDALDESNKK